VVIGATFLIASLFDFEDCHQPHESLSTVLTGKFTCVQNCDFFVNRPLCYVISQQLGWALHVVPWAASIHFNVEA